MPASRTSGLGTTQVLAHLAWPVRVRHSAQGASSARDHRHWLRMLGRRRRPRYLPKSQ